MDKQELLKHNIYRNLSPDLKDWLLEMGEINEGAIMRLMAAIKDMSVTDATSFVTGAMFMAEELME